MQNGDERGSRPRKPLLATKSVMLPKYGMQNWKRNCKAIPIFRESEIFKYFHKEFQPSCVTKGTKILSYPICNPSSGGFTAV